MCKEVFIDRQIKLVELRCLCDVEGWGRGGET